MTSDCAYSYGATEMPGRSLRIARIAGIPVGGQSVVACDRRSDYVVARSVLLPRSHPRHQPCRLVRVGSRQRAPAVCEHPRARVRTRPRRAQAWHRESRRSTCGCSAASRGCAARPTTRATSCATRSPVPSVTAVIGPVLRCRRPAVALLDTGGRSRPGRYQALVNGRSSCFNLLPAFPLDGGRVLRSLLWRRSGEIGKSTETAASVGRGFGYLMIGFGWP